MVGVECQPINVENRELKVQRSALFLSSSAVSSRQTYHTNAAVPTYVGARHLEMIHAERCSAMDFIIRLNR